MQRRLTATPALVKIYIDLFVNRRAYTLQSIRPRPESGRHYYYRPKERGSGAPLLLTEKTVSDHLEGKITIGLYAINPLNQRCKWVAIDADYARAMEDLIKLQHQLTHDRVESALEMSKRGGHLWIFLAVPLLARKCRVYIHDLAQKLGVPIKVSGLADGIEVFPKHDEIQQGAFGNAIRGPLGIHRGAKRRFWFYGADYTLDAQIEFLTRLRKLTEEELDRFTAGKELPPSVAKVRSEVEPLNGSDAGGRRRRGFCILDYMAESRVVGRNYVARCPSCALRGRDRGRDNLAVLVSDPRFYQCWAGCTKEMIRAAVGKPIPVRNTARNEEVTTFMGGQKFNGVAGLLLARRAVRMLKERGIYAQSLLSVERQQPARRYVIRGLESGGSAGDVGRYVTFADEDGRPLEHLFPVESIAVNGLHAVVISTAILRADMLRKGRTYELLVTRHWLSPATDGQRPQLESEVVFRGVHGRLELDLGGKDKAQAGNVVPTFYSLAGEVSAIPEKFVALVRAMTKGVNCSGCSHAHYVRKPRPAGQSKLDDSVHRDAINETSETLAG